MTAEAGKPKNMNMGKVMVGIPVQETYPHQFFGCFYRLMKANPYLSLCQVSGQPTPKARNEIVKVFLQSKQEYLFFLDTDMTFPSNIIHKLLQANKEVVGALYYGRVPPFLPEVFKIANGGGYHFAVKPRSGIVEVDAIGAGGLLVKREVFEKMPSPWFRYSLHGNDEDLVFCDGVKLHGGYKIYANTDVIMGHLSTREVISEENFMVFVDKGCVNVASETLLIQPDSQGYYTYLGGKAVKIVGKMIE